MALGTKNCQWCQAQIIIKATRDLVRRKYCSRQCRQRFRYANGEMDMEKVRATACTPEANAKKVNRGPANGCFKINRADVKCRLRPETNIFRATVFARDNHACVLCGNTQKLIADHIKPYAHYPALRYTPENGRTLCVNCHRKTSTYALTKIAFVNSQMLPEIFELINAGCTQRETAEIFGISEGAMSRIVNKKVRYARF